MVSEGFAKSGRRTKESRRSTITSREARKLYALNYLLFLFCVYWRTCSLRTLFKFRTVRAKAVSLLSCMLVNLFAQRVHVVSFVRVGTSYELARGFVYTKPTLRV